MRELSLIILDLVDNSLKSSATFIKITVTIDENFIVIEISDNGKGMSRDFASKATDPFVTTQIYRNVGLGLSLAKMSAEMSGGTFYLNSKVNEGTIVNMSFSRNHIDRPPLGNLAETMCAMLPSFENVELFFEIKYFEKTFEFETATLKENFDGLSLSDPIVLKILKVFLQENIQSVLGGVII